MLILQFLYQACCVHLSKSSDKNKPCLIAEGMLRISYFLTLFFFFSNTNSIKKKKKTVNSLVALSKPRGFQKINSFIFLLSNLEDSLEKACFEKINKMIIVKKLKHADKNGAYIKKYIKISLNI